MGLFACGRSSSTDAPAIETAAPVTAKLPIPSKTATRAFDLVSALPHCDVYHHGLLLDFGSAAMDGREPWRLGPNPDIANVEREGATWARITGRSISLLFPVDEAHPLTVKARIRGISSQSAAVLLDEKPWSTLTFSRNQSRTVSASVTSTALVPVASGVHTLTLRFSGKATAGDAFAELDWLRIGPANEEEPPAYASPTQRDVAQNVALSGLPHRTLSLRAPSSLRCSVGVAPGARLRTAIGLLD